MSQLTVTSPTEMKTNLANLTPDELKSLQDIYYDRWRRNWLRANGWLNLFLGALTLWLGLSGISTLAFPKIIQTIMGFLIVGQCLWAISSPSTPAMLRFATIFLLAGIWNMLLAIIGGFSGFAFLVGLLAIAQLYSAYDSYKHYQRYQRMSLGEPQGDAVRLYNTVWKTMTKGGFKDDTDSIYLSVGRARWQGLLLEDKVVYALRGRNMLVIQPKEAAHFVPKSTNAMMKRQVDGRINLNTIFERAMMKRDSFEKYARWRGEDVILANETLSGWQRLPRAIRIVAAMSIWLIIAYLTFEVLGAIRK